MKTLFIVLMSVVLLNAATITLTIDNAKIARITTALAGLYPIPQDSLGVPQFTQNQWGKECLRRWLVKQVQRYEQRQAIDAIDIQEEDDLIQ